MSAGSFTSGVSASRPPLVHPRLHLAKGPLSDSIAASGLPVGLGSVEVASMRRRGCVVPTIAWAMLLMLTAIRRLTYVDLSVLPVSSLPPPSNCPQCCQTSSASPSCEQQGSLECTIALPTGCPVQHPSVLTAHLLVFRPLTGPPSTDVRLIQCSRRSDCGCVV